MRKLSLFSLLIFGLGWTGPNNKSFLPGELNGTWQPVTQEFAGKPIPAAAFEKQKLILLDNTYTVLAESVDKGEISYNSGKMDIYGKEGVNNGKHFTAIYKLENGQLTICYDLSGSGYPESFETTGRPMFFLSVFKKEPAN